VIAHVAQLAQLMLHFFVLIAPVAVGIFSASSSNTWATAGLACVLAFFINSTFTAMWLVANELEVRPPHPTPHLTPHPTSPHTPPHPTPHLTPPQDPFGIDPNDIPMMSFHNEFCCNLQGLLLQPWMARDEWIVKSSEWKRPDPPAPPPPESAGAQPPKSAHPDECSSKVRFKGEKQGSLGAAKRAASFRGAFAPSASPSAEEASGGRSFGFRPSKRGGGKETHDVVSLGSSEKAKASKLEENRMITDAVTSQMLCFPNPDDDQFRVVPTLEGVASGGVASATSGLSVDVPAAGPPVAEQFSDV
jgi:hypothetical protein